MGEKIQLTAADGHQFAAYLAKPSGTPRGGLVICQEIFGVNVHIRSVADGYAEAGYLCVAPALFDRVEREVVLGYDEDDVATGRAYRAEVTWDQAVADVAASLGVLMHVGQPEYRLLLGRVHRLARRLPAAGRGGGLLLRRSDPRIP